MAITKTLKVSQATGVYNDFGWADVVAENGDSSVTVNFAQLQAPLAVEASVRTSAGLQKPGLVVTASGTRVTVANNGTTTTIASGDLILIKAFSANGI